MNNIKASFLDNMFIPKVAEFRLLGCPLDAKLRYSDSLSSKFISDNSTREEDKYEEYIKTVHELNVNGVIL